MIIPLNVSIETLCSKDTTRPAMAHPWLEVHPAGSYLVATDGARIARINVVTSAEDFTGFVPVEALALARKLKVKEILCGETEVSFQTNATYAEKARVIRFARPDRSAGQDFSNVFKRADYMKPAKHIISLNANMLAEIQATLGASAVRVEVVSDQTAMRVRGIVGGKLTDTTVELSQGDALLMPYNVA